MNKKVLVTGASGFVGKHMISCLANYEMEVISADRQISDNLSKKIVYIDLLDEQSVNEAIQSVKPSYLIHLAGQSNVGQSWEKKKETLSTNIIGTVNLLETVRIHCPDCRILSIGSSEEYGFIEPAEVPVKETSPVRPMSPYGASKLTVGMLAMQYSKAYQMDIMHTRTFNHIGPGQSLGFVTQDFAREIVEIEKKRREPIVRVGNLEAIRDFTDVRDIVSAYAELLLKGKTGQIYNVCSGKGVKIKEVLEEFISLSSISIEVSLDVSKLRPSDVLVLVGDNSKLVDETRWVPKIPIRQSLEDILVSHRERL